MAYVVPVLVVSYFPLNAQGWIDLSVTTDVAAPYAEIKERTAGITRSLVDVLQQGSRFRAYNNSMAPPSLQYEIVDFIEFLEPMPLSAKRHESGNPLPDYNAIMQRIDIEAWIMGRNVSEIWIWGYHGSEMHLWESNMAGPWGDISNSDRDPDDLPVLDKTYTVFHYNYQRGLSEATEDHMHQIESVLGHIDADLFWNRFVGATGEGRCGWSHIPPNASYDYDWANRRYAWTDIEDWRPDGGGRRLWQNCSRWHGDSLHWFIYWMQSLPGADNGLSYRGHALTNWWRFLGEFDRCMEEGLGLVD